MHGFVMTGIGAGGRERLDDPTPRPQDVIVRPTYSGLCGTDVHMFREGSLTRPEALPVVMGHEFSGTVVALGSAVAAGETCRPYGETDRLRIGDTVAVEPILPCGTCTACLRGKPNLCPNWGHLGILENGAWADFVRVPAVRVTKLPEGLSSYDAALAEPLACAVNFVSHKGKIAGGETVAILGGGPIGLLSVAVAKACGAGKVIVSEPVASRRQAAEAMGADVVVDPTSESLIDVVRQHSYGGLGAELTIEATGAKIAVAQSIDVAAPGSRIVLSGIGGPPTTAIDTATLVVRELTVLGGFASRWAMRTGLDLLATGAVRTDLLVSSVRNWADATTAMDDMVTDTATCKILFSHGDDGTATPSRGAHESPRSHTDRGGLRR